MTMKKRSAKGGNAEAFGRVNNEVELMAADPLQSAPMSQSDAIPISTADIQEALADGFQMSPLPAQLEPLVKQFGGRKVVGVAVPLPPNSGTPSDMSELKFRKAIGALFQLMREAAKAKRMLGPNASSEDVQAEVEKAVRLAALNRHRSLAR